MNNEEKVNYFIIDSKNSFAFISFPLNTIKDNLAMKQTDEETNAKNKRQINNLILKVINTNSTAYRKNHIKTQTNFDISTDISLHYIKNNKDYINSLTSSMNNILNNSFSSNEINFNDNIINDIAIVLFYSFFNIYYCNRHFKITTQSDFNDAIMTIGNESIEVVHLFANTINNKTISNINNSQSNKSMISLSSTADSNLNYSFIKYQPETKYYFYSHTEEEKYVLPKVLIALLNKFYIIKRINISISDLNATMINQWLIILLNVKSLFLNLLEVNYSLVSEQITSLLNSVYDNEIKAKQNKYIESISSSISSSIDFQNQLNEENKKDNNTHQQTGFINKMKQKSQKILNALSKLPHQGKEILFGQKTNSSVNINEAKITQMNNYELIDVMNIKQIEHKLNLLMIISYNISQWDGIRVLKLEFNDPYDQETEAMFNHEKNSIGEQESFFINYIINLKKLLQLTICFNSLDNISFRSIIFLVLNCSRIKRLYLQLFSSEENYSCGALFKLCKKLSIDTNELYNNQSILELKNIHDDLSHLMIDKMINSFCINLDFLFKAIRSSSLSLNELDLNFNLPSIIQDDDLYITLLVKFILNIFIFIINDKHVLNSVKISAPQLSFNDRKIPLINQFLESIDYNTSLNKQNNIQRLSIQLRFLSVVNISKMIMKNLKMVFIGDLDPETFKAFTKYYTSKEFISESHLEKISIGLSVVIINLSIIKDEFISLYQHYPSNLLEVFLYSNLTITLTNIIQLLNIINYNPIEKYVLHLNKNQSDIINNDANIITSINKMYQTSQTIQIKIKYVYQKLRFNSVKSILKNTEFQVKNPLLILRDYLSEKKIVQFM